MKLIFLADGHVTSILRNETARSPIAARLIDVDDDHFALDLRALKDFVGFKSGEAVPGSHCPTTVARAPQKSVMMADK